MAHRYNDERFDRKGQARIATLRRMHGRIQDKMAAVGDRHDAKHWLNAELTAVGWALAILLGDHSRAVGDAIKETRQS